MKTAMDKNLDKLEKGNHLNGSSFWGVFGALFLILMFNFYLFQLFLSFFNSDFFEPVFILINGFYFIVFFMVQAGILKVIYRKITLQQYKISSPVKSTKEFFRFVLFIVFGIGLILFYIGFYPLTQFSTSIFYEILFSLASIIISYMYWIYVEHFNPNSVNVPKFLEYDSSMIFVLLVCLIAFGTAAVFFPYLIIGPLGFGLWLIILSRILLGE